MQLRNQESLPMKTRVKTLMLAASLMLLGLSGGAMAETAEAGTDAGTSTNPGANPGAKKHNRAEIRQLLLDANPGMPITRISKGRFTDYYEVVIPGATLYVHETGGHFFAGDLYQIGVQGLVNVTESNRSNRRREALAALDEADMIVFSPAKGRIKATVSVFTDIDCGYCRKLHQEVPELNSLGIAVRYLAFPRAGAGSESWDKTVSAWCAEDQQLAMTQAKAGMEIDKKICANPVAQHYSLVDDFGITGTPAIIDESGNLIAGYVPALELARRLGVVN